MSIDYFFIYFLWNKLMQPMWCWFSWQLDYFDFFEYVLCLEKVVLLYMIVVWPCVVCKSICTVAVVYMDTELWTFLESQKMFYNKWKLYHVSLVLCGQFLSKWWILYFSVTYWYDIEKWTTCIISWYVRHTFHGKSNVCPVFIVSIVKILLPL